MAQGDPHVFAKLDNIKLIDDAMSVDQENFKDASSVTEPLPITQDHRARVRNVLGVTRDHENLKEDSENRRPRKEDDAIDSAIRFARISAIDERPRSSRRTSAMNEDVKIRQILDDDQMIIYPEDDLYTFEAAFQEMCKEQQRRS